MTVPYVSADNGAIRTKPVDPVDDLVKIVIDRETFEMLNAYAQGRTHASAVRDLLDGVKPDP